jgi:hypothetical protein
MGSLRPASLKDGTIRPHLGLPLTTREAITPQFVKLSEVEGPAVHFTAGRICYVPVPQERLKVAQDVVLGGAEALIPPPQLL